MRRGLEGCFPALVVICVSTYSIGLYSISSGSGDKITPVLSA